MSTTKIDLNNDPELIDIIAQRAAASFEQAYPNLLSLYDVGSVFSAIAAVFRLEGGPTGAAFTVPNVLAATEAAMRKLLMRGALNEFQRVPPPIPDAAQVEIDRLFGIDDADTAVEAQAARVSERQAQITQCAADWRGLPTADFKRKWPSREHQATIEAAWKLLEDQDNNLAAGYRSQRESREREAHQAFGTTPLSPRNF